MKFPNKRNLEEWLQWDVTAAARKSGHSDKCTNRKANVANGQPSFTTIFPSPYHPRRPKASAGCGDWLGILTRHPHLMHSGKGGKYENKCSQNKDYTERPDRPIASIRHVVGKPHSLLMREWPNRKRPLK